MRGRKPNSINVRWKESCQREHRGDSYQVGLWLCLLSSLILCISLALYMDWQVNISNLDTSSVFLICIYRCLLTLPLRSSRIFQTEALLFTNPLLKSGSLSDSPLWVKSPLSIHLHKAQARDHLQHLFLPQFPTSDLSPAC